MFRSDTKVLGPLGTGHLSPIRDRLSITSGANLWEAYRQLEEVKGGRPISELAALVALVRRVIGIDGQLTTYKSTIDKNFKQWVFGKQAGAAEKFTQEQMEWLRMLKDHGRAE